ERLRARKNVFNRPFATDSTHAPTYYESTARKAIGHAGDTELIRRRSSALEEADIDYLDEEEAEEVEKRPARTTSTKKTKSKKNLLAKIGWIAIGLLILRLIFMDRGVWDYFSTENVIQEKREELS